MTKQQASTEIQRLSKLIDFHNELYHQKNTPELSDYEFDQLQLQLKQLEAQYPDLNNQNSPSNKVGEKPNSKFRSVAHRQPMLSLSNSYSAGEIEKFVSRFDSFISCK